jgi:glycosyltransferase involved in cell wall biosynthesis
MTARMKVVSVLTSEASGGAEFAATAMLDALAERGHETVLISNHPEITSGTQVRSRAIELGPKLSTRTWRELAAGWPRLRRELRRGLEAEAPYDALILHFKKEQLLAATLPARLRSATAWAEWGPVPLQFRTGAPRRVYAAAARRARVIMAISEGTRRSVAALGVPLDKITVVPNAMRAGEIRFDPAGRERVRAELAIDPDEFVVGCISRFHPKKRNDVVIEAVARLGAGAKLIMAGDGETERSLREQAQRLALPAHFLATPHDDVSAVLSAFDVSVFCPSPTEGAPRAVIIAMLASRPCVATGREGVTDLIEPGTGAIVAPDNDVDALAEVLRAYQEDRERRAREGEQARRRAVERFDAPVVAEQVERLLGWADRSRGT